MFDFEHLLVVVADPESVTGPVVEACGNYDKDLKNLYVCCPDSSDAAILEYLKSLPNSTYTVRLFNKSKSKALGSVYTYEGYSSFTDEFIKLFGSAQALLDSVLGEGEKVSEGDITIDETFPIIQDSVEDIVEGSDSEMPSDIVEDTVPDTISYADTDGKGTEDESKVDDSTSSKTLETSEVSYKEETKAEVATMQVAPEMFDELMLMVRGISRAIGLTEFDDQNTLNKEDLSIAADYITTLSAQSLRDGICAVLRGADTKADQRVMTRFLEKFLLWVQTNNIDR